jgi:hypothetical protein
MHLNDTDIPGKLKFIESDFLDAGENFTIFDTEY